MRYLLRLAVLAWALVTAVAVAAHPLFRSELRFTERSENNVEANTLPPPPSQDPWYRAPAGWEKTSPGAILRIRKAPYLQYMVGNALSSYFLPTYPLYHDNILLSGYLPTTFGGG